MIKVFRSPSVSFLYLRRRTCGFAVFRVLVRARCRGAASASLHVFVLAGTREGLESRSSSVNSLVGVAAPSDLVGSIYSENPS